MHHNQLRSRWSLLGLTLSSCLGADPAWAQQTPPATQPSQVVAVESSYDEVDFTGGPAVTVNINIPDGGEVGVGVYRSRTPGQYWLLGIPLPLKPDKPALGYPPLVYSGRAPGKLASSTRLPQASSTTHRVEFRFQLYTRELLTRAAAEVAKSPTELKYLKDAGIDPAAGVEVKPAPISSAIIELHYFDDVIAAARTRSIARLSSFSAYFDLDDQQLADVTRGIADGQLKFMAHVRSKGEARG